jgi:hypothetical protein
MSPNLLPDALPPVIGGTPPLIAPLPPPASPQPWGIWETLGFTAAVVGAFISVQTVVVLVWLGIAMAQGQPPSRRGLETNGLLLALAAWASAPVAIALTFLFAALRRQMPPADYLGLRRVSLGAAIRWTIAVALVLVLSDWITTLLGRPTVPDFMLQVCRTAGFLPLLVVTIVVVMPVAEELLFRGFLFSGLLHSRLGPVGAVLVTALFWSVMHLQYDAYGIATIFVLGLMLGYARLKTRSLYLTIFLHALNNLVATIQALMML